MTELHRPTIAAAKRMFNAMNRRLWNRCAPRRVSGLGPAYGNEQLSNNWVCWNGKKIALHNGHLKVG